MAHVEYDGDDMIQVQLLNCDSINQAKEKILNVIYKVNVFRILRFSSLQCFVFQRYLPLSEPFTGW